MCEQLYTQLDKFFVELKRQPLPTFTSRYPHRFESILGSATLAADLRSFDIADLAAYYLVFIARGHPLVEGNKRAAVACCLAYLFLEGFFLKVTPMGLYEATVTIAQVDTAEEVLRKVIAEILRKKMAKI